jgi:hypothetical protein
MVRTVLVASIVAGTLAHASAQEPALPDALGKAAEYVAQYRLKASGLAVEEQLLLTEMASVRPIPRRLASDLVLVNIQERLMGLRDPFSIDTKAIRERQPRITKVLAEPTRAAWQQVQEFTKEGAYHFMANVVLWYGDPVLALRFVEKEHQPRMTYKIEGKKKMNGVEVYAIGFKETREERKVYLIDTPDNPNSSGRIWIDPATGAVHQTELWLQADTAVVRVTVLYAPDAKLNLLVPRESTQSFEARQRGTGTTDMGSGGANNSMKYESNAKYTNAQLTPIDLSKIVR